MNESVKRAARVASEEAAKGEIARYVIVKLREAAAARGLPVNEKAALAIVTKLETWLTAECNAAIDSTNIVAKVAAKRKRKR